MTAKEFWDQAANLALRLHPRIWYRLCAVYLRCSIQIGDEGLSGPVILFPTCVLKAMASYVLPSHPKLCASPILNTIVLPLLTDQQYGPGPSYRVTIDIRGLFERTLLSLHPFLTHTTLPSKSSSIYKDLPR